VKTASDNVRSWGPLPGLQKGKDSNMICTPVNSRKNGGKELIPMGSSVGTKIACTNLNAPIKKRGRRDLVNGKDSERDGWVGLK